MGSQYALHMGRLVAFAVLTLCGACAPNEQQDSIRTVEAVELPIVNPADRTDLVAILRRHAAADGAMHVDEVSHKWRTFEASTNTVTPKDRGTIFVGVWRGNDDDKPEADVDDSDHPGRAWLTFARGTLPAKSNVFRMSVMRDVLVRWPNAKSLPVLTGGNIPLEQDLKLTSKGYRVDPTAAARYGLSPESPFVAK